MNSQGFLIEALNNFFAKLQNRFDSLGFVSDFIDKIIFILIGQVIFLSTFVQSEILGVIALLVFFLTVFQLFIKKNEQLQMNVFEKFLFVWFLVVIVSLFGSSLFSLSLKGFFKTITYMGFYFSAVQFYRKNINLIMPTLCLIAFCAISQGIIGIIQNFRGIEEISTWQDTSNINPEDVLTRVYGSLKPLNPNLFGGYLIASIPSIIGCAAYNFNKKKFKYAFVFSLFLILTVISLFLSGCRGAYVAFAFMLACFVLYFGKIIYEKNNEKFKRLYFTLVSFFMALGTGAVLFVSSIRTRILSIFVLRADSSTSFRFNVYKAAIEMIKDNWLFGIGVGNKNFREIYGLYMKTGFDALSTYNVFTELWVESGIFALLAFLLFLGFIVKGAFSYIIKNQQNRLIVVVGMISILSVMVHGLFDTVYFRPQIQFIFWLMTAFISSVLYTDNCKCS